MLREPAVPSGPRPAAHPPRQSSKENYDPAVPPPRMRAPLGREPPPVQNKLPLYTFGGYDPTGELLSTSGGTHDFLPSVSFDDLHQSIASAGDRVAESYEIPRESLVTENMILGGDMGGTNTHTQNAENTETKPVTIGPRAIPPPTTRPGRSGSLLQRRLSTSNRKASMSSMVSTNAAGNMDPPTGRIAMRPPRSQYPPISTSNASKGPRKSIGMGEADPDGMRTQRRGPNSISGPQLTPSTSIQSMQDVVAAGRALGANMSGEGSRLATPRSSKAKSLQPPSRAYQQSARTTPDRNRASSFVSKSPGRISGRNTATPSSSANRMSTMPGLPTSNSHASGLGARTVSPTDARRLKRLSTLQAAPPMPHTPPAGSLEAAMAAHKISSHSPSSIPQSTTPSSLQTTPDLSRRSYIAAPQQNGGFTPRSSTNSLQPRLPQLPTNSRLPTPKLNTSFTADDTEQELVPPVPAIPKAYESPKDTAHFELSMWTRRKSNLNLDTCSIISRNSSSTNEWSAGTSTDKQRRLVDSITKPCIKPTSSARSEAEEKKRRQPPPPAQKKQLQPLRLPPLNLLPLSTPTEEKIAQLTSDAASKANGRLTPPMRINAKTPTTPMTASKTSFFSSRHRQQRTAEDGQSRSNTSIQQREKNIMDSPAKPIPTPARAPRQSNVSPFVSSSLPKSSSEFSFMNRVKPSGDYTDDASNDARQTKVNGPRAHKLTKSPKVGSPKIDQAGSPGKEDGKEGSSIRRKLSLSWKRNTSKNSIGLSQAQAERDGEYPHPPQPPKHDSRYNDMPPPRLPVSKTLNDLGSHTNNTGSKSPTGSPKTMYLDSKRRKSSVSSLKIASQQDKERNLEQWASPAKEKQQEVKKPMLAEAQTPRLAAPTSTARIPTSSQMVLGPKASSMSLKMPDRWTMDLDRDDMIAEEEMKRLAMRRRETEQAARLLDSLTKRATPKQGVCPKEAIEIANLNIYERGEVIDFQTVYFTGTSTAAKHVGTLQSNTANHGYDDERGDYTIIVGDHLAYRYEIVDILGKGSFGQVVRCIDHMTGGLVAVKIIRNKKRFHQQALVEVDILRKLKEWDPKGKHSLVSFTSSFYFRSHLCISTELLDMNLYEFIKYNQFRGFSLKLIRRFTKQLLNSLLLLKRHKVIHCDLKPENILLTHPAHTELRVIDFGSSCFENQQVYTYIQSRFYRSPEVILGLEYGLAIDMWSVGCILAELWSGYPIFPGENEMEQLACIMEVFGPPERHVIDKSGRKKLFFDSLGKPRLSVSSKGRRRKPSSKTLSQVLKCDDEPFLDFLTKCLRWDQDRRLKPEEAMCHEFITGKKLSSHHTRGYSSRTERESPIKRYNQIVPPTQPSGSHGTRPLPIPPISGSGHTQPGFMNGTGASKARESPHKPSSSGGPNGIGLVGGQAGIRRTSNWSGGQGFAGMTQASAQKRTSVVDKSTGNQGGVGSSTIPRAMRSGVGQVTMGNRGGPPPGGDLAAQGASAAMKR